MVIRRAEEKDIESLLRLLSQVLSVHHEGRPDIFKKGAVKYKKEELVELIADPQRPIFVAEDAGCVKGYAFCVLEQKKNHNILTDIKTLYIDDLCVDETCRGQHIGKSLYEYVLAYAKEIGCYNVTLNVWALNESAMKFYEACGLSVQKVGMERIL